MSDEETITITKAEYDELLSDSRFLGCLQAGGVDNWDWYGEAQRDYIDTYGEF